MSEFTLSLGRIASVLPDDSWVQSGYRHAEARLDINVLCGTGDYCGGCGTLRQNMKSEEIHIGLRTKAFGGCSLSGDYRLNERLSVRFGELAGERRAKSAWRGVRIDSKK